MLPAFFDSVLELIVKTSTELPPDVRAAMEFAEEERAHLNLLIREYKSLVNRKGRSPGKASRARRH